MKIAYLVTGLGEFAQAEALASYAKRKGDQNFFIIGQDHLKMAAQEAGFKTAKSKGTQETIKIVERLKPDVLFLCNSKTVFAGQDPLLEKEASSYMKSNQLYTCSLDSNWLFFKDKRVEYPEFLVPEWINRIYVVLPKIIFQLGLQKNGGHYKIPSLYKKKIFCSGFIPSVSKISQQKRKQVRKEFNFKKKEKLIFIYLGAREDQLFSPLFLQIKKIIYQFRQKGFKIKVLFKSERRRILKEKWLILKSWLTTPEFNHYLASSDLLILHHGLATLPKAIGNQIPTICLVPELKKDLPFYLHSEFYEIEPFRKLNLCYSLPYSVSQKRLKESIKELLYQPKERKKMKQAQEKYFQPGEENVYKDLKKI